PTPNASDGNNVVYSVEAIGSADVWAVGSYRDDQDIAQSLVIHWDGQVWSIVPAPSPGADGNELYAVSGGSSTDVWAVGYTDPDTGADDTLIEHWDGSAWSVVPSPSPGPDVDALYGVDALTSGDAWSVGYHLATGDLIEAL